MEQLDHKSTQDLKLSIPNVSISAVIDIIQEKLNIDISKTSDDSNQNIWYFLKKYRSVKVAVQLNYITV